MPSPKDHVHAAVLTDELWGPRCDPSLLWTVPLIPTGEFGDDSAVTCPACAAQIRDTTVRASQRQHARAAAISRTGAPPVCPSCAVHERGMIDGTADVHAIIEHQRLHSAWLQGQDVADPYAP